VREDQDVFTFDPVAMHVVNRVASGSRLQGQQHYEGGLLVQGEVSGEVCVQGTLVIWSGGVVLGDWRVSGDVFLLGTLGSLEAAATASRLECLGTVYVTASGVSNGTLLARQLRLYDGADLRGPFHTLKNPNPTSHGCHPTPIPSSKDRP